MYKFTQLIIKLTTGNVMTSSGDWHISQLKIRPPWPEYPAVTPGKVHIFFAQLKLERRCIQHLPRSTLHSSSSTHSTVYTVTQKVNHQFVVISASNILHITRGAWQSQTWGRPAPQVRVESQFRYWKFLSQQRQLANDYLNCIIEPLGVWTCVGSVRAIRVSQYGRFNLFCGPKFITCPGKDCWRYFQ